MNDGYARPLAGLTTVVVIGSIVALTIAMFRGDFTRTASVTVISDRAGLVMNPDAKVKMRGVQIGSVTSIGYRPDGTAALNLAIYRDEMRNVPENVLVDIASTTVFGAKSVQFKPPRDPSARSLRPGQELVGQRVTVETNTIFQQLTRLLAELEPTKVNAILETLSRAFSGRGEKLGQAVSDLNAFLAELEPNLPDLSRDLELLPPVLAAYADAAPDLVATAHNVTVTSRTLVDRQAELDAFLVAAIGLADTGTDVIGANSEPLKELVHLLVPTTDMLNRNHELLSCAANGLVPLTKNPPLPEPGVLTLAGIRPGIERYRYPSHLPKVNATGSPQLCQMLGLPELEAGEVPPFVVTDIGANPWEYGNEGIILNSDGIKRWLFGDIDGPPRNSAQIGMPG
ncbi:MCE family protein [Mycolicibacterium hippocampi]|uniref:Virulence factor n=1 Tax=Mycolicibacterium hippocampi TaxID=659824 RepID=A0A7I9ZSV5_9MYCO|nr:MCE family protein [Mycolicibacterium hippocampi]GFH03758.1 virulence factor [Mycolicibacterium hippocampi]